MKSTRSVILIFLILSVCFSLIGCGKTIDSGYEVLDRLDTEQFAVAFRSGDNLCEIVTAALNEIAADGLLTRLSSQYLGADYSCLSGSTGALSHVTVPIPDSKVLLVGIQDGMAPLCSMDNDGNFIGLIPDMVNGCLEKLGWSVKYIEILPENVAVELGSGNIDCAWLPASYNTSAFSLSPGWMENSHLLVIRKSSGITKVKNLKSHSVGLTDNTSLKALENNTKIFDTLTIWTYKDIRTCFNALAAGQCDAIVIDSIVSAHYF